MRVAVSVLLLVAAFIPRAPGQTPRRESTPNDTLVSPEVLADKRVSFRIYAPKASEVTLRGDWMGQPGPVQLVKDERGVWSVTTEPLRPDFYSYNFTVDGVWVTDPKNPMIKPGIATNDSIFFVPGEDADLHLGTGLHGEVQHAAVLGEPGVSPSAEIGNADRRDAGNDPERIAELVNRIRARPVTPWS